MFNLSCIGILAVCGGKIADNAFEFVCLQPPALVFVRLNQNTFRSKRTHSVVREHIL